MMNPPEHPDLQRLRSITADNAKRWQALPAIEESLEELIDVGVAEELVTNYIRTRRDLPVVGTDPAKLAMFTDPGSVKIIGTVFTHGFLLGMQFQAAGGHREVPDGQ